MRLRPAVEDRFLCVFKNWEMSKARTLPGVGPQPRKRTGTAEVDPLVPDISTPQHQAAEYEAMAKVHENLIKEAATKYNDVKSNYGEAAAIPLRQAEIGHRANRQRAIGAAEDLRNAGYAPTDKHRQDLADYYDARVNQNLSDIQETRRPPVEHNLSEVSMHQAHRDSVAALQPEPAPEKPPKPAGQDRLYIREGKGYKFSPQPSVTQKQQEARARISQTPDPRSYGPPDTSVGPLSDKTELSAPHPDVASAMPKTVVGKPLQRVSDGGQHAPEQSTNMNPFPPIFRAEATQVTSPQGTAENPIQPTSTATQVTSGLPRPEPTSVQTPNPQPTVKVKNPLPQSETEPTVNIKAPTQKSLTKSLRMINDLFRLVA